MSQTLIARRESEIAGEFVVLFKSPSTWGRLEFRRRKALIVCSHCFDRGTHNRLGSFATLLPARPTLGKSSHE